MDKMSSRPPTLGLWLWGMAACWQRCLDTMSGEREKVAGRDETDIVFGYSDRFVVGQNVQSVDAARVVVVGVCHAVHWTSLTGTLSSARRLLVRFVTPEPSEDSGLSNRLTLPS